MATFDKAFADRIVKGNGWLDGDSADPIGDNPRCLRIVKYRNFSGGDGYGATFAHERDQNKYLEETEYVQNPVIYWEAKPL